MKVYKKDNTEILVKTEFICPVLEQLGFSYQRDVVQATSIAGRVDAIEEAVTDIAGEVYNG